MTRLRQILNGMTDEEIIDVILAGEENRNPCIALIDGKLFDCNKYDFPGNICEGCVRDGECEAKNLRAYLKEELKEGNSDEE